MYELDKAASARKSLGQGGQMGDADQVTHLANGGHLAKLAN